MWASVDNDEFKNIQIRELGYWANTPYAPENPWYYYDREFIGFLDRFERVIDVGCGPVPYLMNHNVRFKSGFAIDPLIRKYMNIPRYKPYWDLFGNGIAPANDTSEIAEMTIDGAFMLNVIDHAKNPTLLIEQVWRCMVPNGRLFVYVDLDKPADSMHPHVISFDELYEKLDLFFDRRMCKVARSWKFPNNILYYVGDKL